MSSNDQARTEPAFEHECTELCKMLLEEIVQNETNIQELKVLMVPSGQSFMTMSGFNRELQRREGAINAFKHVLCFVGHPEPDETDMTLALPEMADLKPLHWVAIQLRMKDSATLVTWCEDGLQCGKRRVRLAHVLEEGVIKTCLEAVGEFVRITEAERQAYAETCEDLEH